MTVLVERVPVTAWIVVLRALTEGCDEPNSPDPLETNDEQRA